MAVSSLLPRPRQPRAKPLRYTTWTAPLPDDGASEEFVLTFDGARERRLLILPPLFDEHNKMRRQIVEIMRKLDQHGIDSFLPDLPGCNESRAELSLQTLGSWRTAAAEAARIFSASGVFAVRGGALLVPQLPGHVYAPLKGRQLLRSMLRARTIAAREAGQDEKVADLLDQGRETGLELGGWNLGPQMITQLEEAEPPARDDLRVVDHAAVGGSPLWLRAEPDDDPKQADAIAELVASAEAQP